MLQDRQKECGVTTEWGIGWWTVRVCGKGFNVKKRGSVVAFEIVELETWSLGKRSGPHVCWGSIRSVYVVVDCVSGHSGTQEEEQRIRERNLGSSNILAV